MASNFIAANRRSSLIAHPSFLIVLLLLSAFALRVYNLSSLPPGLTHDEANHGREAIGILDGDLLFYFPLNYGSEPLYSYTAAASMMALGENPFALRLVNVFASILTLSVSYLWIKTALNRQTAVLTLALLALSFWPLAASRQALRVGLLPLFTVTAVYFFWRLVFHGQTWRRAALFGFFIAVTIHIYLAARVAWLVFPLFLLYLALFHRERWRQSWRFALGGLLLAGLLVIPLFAYLEAHPEALTRLDMLDRPLQALKSGDPRPVLENVVGGLLAFVQPGGGDQFLAYNIPGRPVLNPLTAVFFLIGIAISLWRWRRPPYLFLLLWFGVGIAPSLITGATANTTRNMAALTAVYLLPAVGFMAIANRKEIERLGEWRFGIAIVWLLFTGWTTAQAYFVEWGQSPAVRDAYQHNLIETMAYLEENEPTIPVVISSVYPGPAHDPSIGLVAAAERPYQTRWTDARWALIFPDGMAAQAMIPASTPPHPVFGEWLTAVETVPLRPDDLNPSFTAYQLAPPPTPSGAMANFNDGVELLEARWLQTAVAPGETAELLTLWRVLDPEQLGPKSTPLHTTDLVMFTQLLDESGQVLAQRDALNAPSWDWQTGDVVVQIHPVAIPLETAVGAYQPIVGLYDRASGQRLSTLNNGAMGESYVNVPSLQIE